MAVSVAFVGVIFDPWYVPVGFLLTFLAFPREQWKCLRTTNSVERLNEEFRRRIKTQASLPSEQAVVVLLFALLDEGLVRLRRIDGWEKISEVLLARTVRAA